MDHIRDLEDFARRLQTSIPAEPGLEDVTVEFRRPRPTSAPARRPRARRFTLYAALGLTLALGAGAIHHVNEPPPSPTPLPESSENTAPSPEFIGPAGREGLPSALAASQAHPELAEGRHGPAELALRRALRGVRGEPLAADPQPVRFTSITPNAMLGASASANTVRLWRPGSPRATVVRELEFGAPVRSIALANDGRWLAVADDDFEVWLFRLDKDAKPTRLSKHVSPAVALAFSRDGRYLVSASEKPNLWRWDLLAPDIAISGVELRHSLTGGAHALGISDVHELLLATRTGGIALWSLDDPRPKPARTIQRGDGRPATLDVCDTPAKTRWASRPRWLVVGDGDGARLFNLDRRRSWREPVKLNGHTGLIRHAFVDRDCRRAVTADDSTIRVWSLDARDPSLMSRVLPGPNEGLSALTMSADGSRLVGASFDGQLLSWDLRHSDTAPIGLSATDSPTRTLALSADGAVLLSGAEDGETWRWDPRRLHPSGGSVLAHPTDFARGLMGVAIDPSSTWFVTHGRGSTARLDPLHPGLGQHKPQELIGHQGSIYAAAFDPSGRWIATGGADGRVRLWALEPDAAGMTLARLENVINDVVFSPDGRWLAAASSDRSVRLWPTESLSTGGAARQLTLHDDEVLTLAFSSDGRWLAAGGLDGVILLWDLTEAEVAPQRLTELTRAARQLRFVGGELLAAGERNVIHWALDGTQPPRTHTYNGTITSMSLAPRGQALAIAGDAGLRLVDLDNDKAWTAAHSETIHSAAWSSDGSVLYATDREGALLALSWAEPRALLELGRHGDGIAQLAVSDDDSVVVTAGLDGAVFVWPLERAWLEERARGLIRP